MVSIQNKLAFGISIALFVISIAIFFYTSVIQEMNTKSDQYWRLGLWVLAGVCLLGGAGAMGAAFNGNKKKSDEDSE